MAVPTNPVRGAAGSGKRFSFVLLGDLHFDRLEHHDFDWLAANHTGDRSQIENYSQKTREVMPEVLGAVARRATKNSDETAFVVQVGDLVQGLCGSAELSARQNEEALSFLADAGLKKPFLLTKGNHDITGDGAREAFERVFHPFMRKEAQRVAPGSIHSGANYSVTHAGCQFVFMDAYAAESLDWLEAMAAQRTANHLFVTVHPPVVPYGARASWHLYQGDHLASKRERLLEILGRQEAVVLGGHLHKFSAIRRRAGGGQFTQLAVSSVVSSVDAAPRDVLNGVDEYTADQVKLEPNHSPETEAERRAIYDRERGSVTNFHYANSAGYAVITVEGDQIEAAIHAGTQTSPFQRIDLRG